MSSVDARPIAGCSLHFLSFSLLLADENSSLLRQHNRKIKPTAMKSNFKEDLNTSNATTASSSSGSSSGGKSVKWANNIQTTQVWLSCIQQNNTSFILNILTIYQCAIHVIYGHKNEVQPKYSCDIVICWICRETKPFFIYRVVTKFKHDATADADGYFTAFFCGLHAFPFYVPQHFSLSCVLLVIHVQMCISDWIKKNWFSFFCLLFNHCVQPIRRA